MERVIKKSSQTIPGSLDGSLMRSGVHSPSTASAGWLDSFLSPMVFCVAIQSHTGTFRKLPRRPDPATGGGFERGGDAEPHALVDQSRPGSEGLPTDEGGFAVFVGSKFSVGFDPYLTPPQATLPPPPGRRVLPRCAVRRCSQRAGGLFSRFASNGSGWRGDSPKDRWRRRTKRRAAGLRRSLNSSAFVLIAFTSAKWQQRNFAK